MQLISLSTRLPVPLRTLLVLAIGSGLSLAQELTPSQKKQVESMIEDLDRTLNGGAEKNNSRALGTCQDALKSTKATYEFFMDSTKELEFDQAGKREADWREWKERNEDRYKNSEHIAARQFQLRYLVLTLKVMMTKDAKAGLEEVLPDLVSYYDQVADGFEKLEDHHRVLGESVLESVFARRLKLDVSLRRKDNWVYTPLPVSAGYEQLILPYYREANHRSLQAAWDKRIMQESKTMAAEVSVQTDDPSSRGLGPRRGSRDPREREREERREETRQKDVSIEEFRTDRLPELQWGKAKDALLLGPDPAASFADLGRILRDHLSHDQAMNWLAELKTLAGGGKQSGDLVP